jgi:hypothetical protein
LHFETTGDSALPGDPKTGDVGVGQGEEEYTFSPRSLATMAALSIAPTSLQKTVFAAQMAPFVCSVGVILLMWKIDRSN